MPSWAAPATRAAAPAVPRNRRRPWLISPSSLLVSPGPLLVSTLCVSLFRLLSWPGIGSSRADINASSTTVAFPGGRPHPGKTLAHALVRPVGYDPRREPPRNSGQPSARRRRADRRRDAARTRHRLLGAGTAAARPRR